MSHQQINHQWFWQINNGPRKIHRLFFLYAHRHRHIVTKSQSGSRWHSPSREREINESGYDHFVRRDELWNCLYIIIFVPLTLCRCRYALWPIDSMLPHTLQVSVLISSAVSLGRSTFCRMPPNFLRSWSASLCFMRTYSMGLMAPRLHLLSNCWEQSILTIFTAFNATGVTATAADTTVMFIK